MISWPYNMDKSSPTKTGPSRDEDINDHCHLIGCSHSDSAGHCCAASDTVRRAEAWAEREKERERLATTLGTNYSPYISQPTAQWQDVIAARMQQSQMSSVMTGDMPQG